MTSDLASENSRATAVEGILAADLTSESTARTSADVTLTSDLATETTRATAAEGILASDLTSESTARTSADATLTSGLATETIALQQPKVFWLQIWLWKLQQEL